MRKNLVINLFLVLTLKHEYSFCAKKLVLTFCYAVFGLSRVNDGIYIFRLQYETHSLQMHPKFQYRSVVAPMSKLSEQRYALGLVVVPCRYLPSPSPSFQPISPSPSRNISSIVVLHLLRRHIRPYCTASPPPFLFAAVLTSDLFCHPRYPVSPLRLHHHPPASLLGFSSRYVP